MAKIRMLRTEQGYIAGIHLKNFEKGVEYEVGLGVGGVDQALADVFTVRHDKRGPAAEWVNEEEPTMTRGTTTEETPVEEPTEPEKEEEETEPEPKEKEIEEGDPEKDEKLLDGPLETQAMAEAPKDKRDKRTRGKKTPEEESEKKEEDKKFHDHPVAESVWHYMSADEFSKHVRKYAREFGAAEMHIKVKAKAKWERLCHPAPCPFE